MAIGTLKAGVNSQDVTASTGSDVADTVNYLYGNTTIDGLLSDEEASYLTKKSNKVLNLGQRKTAVIWGDSITSQNYIETSDTFNYNSSGYFMWANFFLNNTFELANDAGVSGETSAEILARFETDVAAYNPEFVFVLAGTNDLTDGVDIATITANIDSLVASVKSIGAKCVLCAPPASSAFADETKFFQLNKHIKNSDTDYIVDFAASLTDPSSSTWPCNKANVYTDDRHPNSKGAELMGRAMASVLSQEARTPQFFPANYLDENNFTQNPVNKGATGTVPAGTAPDDVTTTATIPSGSSVTGSVIDGVNSRIYRIDVTGSDNFRVNTRFDTDAINAGKQYVAYLEIIDCEAVNFLQAGMTVQSKIGGTTQYNLHSMRNYDSGSIIEAADIAGVLQSPILQTTVDTTFVSVDFYFECESGFIEIGRVALIEID